MKPYTSNPNISLQLQFRHMPKNRILKQAVRQQLEAFSLFSAEGIRCHVVFDRNKPSNQEPVYQTSIRLHIPHHPLYVVHGKETGTSQNVLLTTLNNAFGELHRQISKSIGRKNRHRRLAA